MTPISLRSFAPGARPLRGLAALACLLVWTQLAAASHLHGDAHAPGDQRHAACALCVVQGAAAPPPATSSVATVVPAATTIPSAPFCPAITPARHTPHAPRAPPVHPRD